MAIFAIDPGPVESGYVIVRGFDVIQGCESVSNYKILDDIFSFHSDHVFAIEDYTSRGVISSHGIETVRWIGRFQQRIKEWYGELTMIRRADVLSMCPKLINSRTGKKYTSDALVRRHMQEMYCNTAMLKSHAWQALGVAFAAQHGKGTVCTK